MLGVWYKSVNFGAEKSPGSPNWWAQIVWARARMHRLFGGYPGSQPIPKLTRWVRGTNPSTFTVFPAASLNLQAFPRQVTSRNFILLHHLRVKLILTGIHAKSIGNLSHSWVVKCFFVPRNTFKTKRFFEILGYDLAWLGRVPDYS
jgi:hypothetical protein